MSDVKTDERELWELGGDAFYPCAINDDLAVVSVDLDAPRHPSREGLQFFHALRVYLQQPDARGLPSDDEFSALYEIEDFVVQLLESTFSARYVGRVTRSGFREFYFYAKWQDLDVEVRERILDRFPDHEFGGGTGEFDPNWERYFECLYPNEMAYQYIILQRAFSHAAAGGNVPPDDVQVSYAFYFDDETHRNNFVSRVKSCGHLGVSELTTLATNFFRVQVERSVPGTPDDIYDAYEELAAIAHDCLGHFSHCEVEWDSYPYEFLSTEVRARIAAEVAAGLRSSSDLKRFGLGANRGN